MAKKKEEAHPLEGLCAKYKELLEKRDEFIQEHSGILARYTQLTAEADDILASIKTFNEDVPEDRDLVYSGIHLQRQLSRSYDAKELIRRDPSVVTLDGVVDYVVNSKALMAAVQAGLVSQASADASKVKVVRDTVKVRY